MAKKAGIKYRIPEDWFLYDPVALLQPLARAEAAAYALIRAPYLQPWSGDPGAAIRAEAAASLKIARPEAVTTVPGSTPASGGGAPAPNAGEEATLDACRWVSTLPADTAVGLPLVTEIHRRLVAARHPGAGNPATANRIRPKDHPFLFGDPPLRGAKGGRECHEALNALLGALPAAGSVQPLLIRGFALHYHLASMRPFTEANGRTARALEAVFRQAAGLRGPHFVSMAAFYASERQAYFDALRAARTAGHDLTPFLEFALGGLAIECGHLFERVRAHTAIALFEHTMNTLFDRIRRGKRQALANRQVAALSLALHAGPMPLGIVYGQLRAGYSGLRNPWKAFLRDVGDLVRIGAIRFSDQGETGILPRLEWPAEITEENFLKHYTQTARSEAQFSRAI